ncbi:hypothetical protein GDO81_019948 [Engystomops pustulosus]|uniref:RNA methyltransferase n=1 Tax=Engystomops pustulosus TaxID=76066 RepID=A0AAV6YYJ5_ENGPU|nr:hypothetical protein GDO81_019948 [Engystomops pustulosus]KAG8540031.1 hypothetical protein GDO81_019948 [Engystomops pustulosus]
MQVLIEMASSSETLQQAVEAGDGEKTFLAPPPEPPPQNESQNRGLKEGLEQNPPRVPRNGFQGKRRNSFNVGFKHPAPFKRRRRVNSDCEPVLPSNFLLGGNIFDPLNLNSLLDEEVNRALNAETPKSSPLPSRNRDPVEILIPKDLTDPLSLNTGSGDVELLLSPLKSGRKRHRHRHHLSTDVPNKAPMGQEAEPVPEELRPYELNTTINCRDEVVALPSLESEATDVSAPATAGSGAPGSRHRKRRRTSSKSEGRHCSPEKGKNLASVVAAVKPAATAEAPKVPCLRSQPKGKDKKRFQFGNYCRYYGYRNPSRTDDPRLRALRPEWFRNKAVLDIGCNVGHLTLSVALQLEPARIVGMDIDGALIQAARQNIRHYLSQSLRGGGFPAALAATRGPIAAPSIPTEAGQEDGGQTFPHNVVFIKGNYVLDRDELLEVQRPEYDVILCLSVTKWVHLNWGDDGLKRMFKRFYRHLRPGGILVLEPQPWSSYGKRKKLTDAIFRNYCRISLRPEQFTTYLLSPDVGFSSYELLATPCTSAKGFQRPIYAFHKSGVQEEPPPSVQG